MNELFWQNPQALARLYEQLGAQVQSYHRHYHLGENSSVPAELARELLESMAYTARQSPLGTLEAGQQMLAERRKQANRLCALVRATAPDWESQCRWETVASLGTYLDRYDHLHFAHRIPENPDYPLLVSPPEGLLGLDYGLFYLNCLWLENQILEAMGEAARGSWEQEIPDYWGIPLNLCEQPLIQLLGRQLLGLALQSSDLSRSNQRELVSLLQDVPKEALRTQMTQLCRALKLSDPNAITYACAAVDSLYPRLRAALTCGDLSQVFL